jgi:hypothetical protein
VIAFVGFFVEMDSNTDGWKFYRWASQLILCVEIIYVVAQFIVNVFELTYLTDSNNMVMYTGLGSEKKLGFRAEKVSIYDSIFPFTGSLIQLFLISVYIRYMGKPKFIIRNK